MKRAGCLQPPESMGTSSIIDLFLNAGKAQLKADGSAANEDDIRIGNSYSKLESNKDEGLLEPNEE